jgi:hypothetical protein
LESLLQVVVTLRQTGQQDYTNVNKSEDQTTTSNASGGGNLHSAPQKKLRG